MNQKTFDYVPDESAKKPEKPKGTKKEFPPSPVMAMTEDGLKPLPDEAPAETGNDLIVIDPKSTELITALSQDKGLDPIIEKIKQRVKTEHLDVTTEEGRARIGSVARDIGKAKMDLKRAGQDLTEDWREKTKAVTSEVSRMEKEMDTLRDEVLSPRTEFNNREAARVNGHKTNLDLIAGLSSFPDPDHPPTSAAVQIRIDRLADFKDIDWQEFTEVAKAAKDKASSQLADMLVRLKKSENDAAELARLRKEQADREQKERDDKIAAEAAETARLAAEKRAAEELAETERKAKESAAAAQKVIDDQAAALAKAEQDKKDAAETKRLADEKAAADAKALAEKVESDKKAALEKAESDKAAALKKQKDDAAAAQKVIDDAAAARAADTANKAKVNNSAKDAIQAIMDDEKFGDDLAEEIVKAIEKGSIPNVTIKY